MITENRGWNHHALLFMAHTQQAMSLAKERRDKNSAKETENLVEPGVWRLGLFSPLCGHVALCSASRHVGGGTSPETLTFYCLRKVLKDVWA